jgi:hypothetical protein
MGAFMISLLAWVIMFVLIVRGVIMNVKFGTKRLLLQILLILVPICLFFIVPNFIKTGQPVFTEGLLEGMKKEADISAIQSWLDTMDLKGPNVREVSESTWSVSESEWPEEIKKFSPRSVIVKKSKNGVKTYVRIRLGGPFIGDWGLVVGVSAEGIPLNDYFTSEYRLELTQNAFVWARIRD